MNNNQRRGDEIIMWAIIDTNKGEVSCLEKTKKECQDTIKWLRLGDMLDGKRNKYIIVKEEEI